MPRGVDRVGGPDQHVKQALPLAKAGIGRTSEGLQKRSAGFERGNRDTACSHRFLPELQPYRNINGKLHKSHASHHVVRKE